MLTGAISVAAPPATTDGSPWQVKAAPPKYRAGVTFGRPAVARAAAGAVLLLAVAACTPAADQPAAAASAPARPDLAAAQQELEQRAVSGLASRSCPALEAGPRLAGLPDGELGCLGTGAGRVVSAGDGRPTVVNLWASWCAPCVREMPLLQDTADRTGAAVRFVGIDTQDTRASAASLLDATGVRYEQLDDQDGEVRTAVRAVGLPVTLVYDAEGRQVARRFGEVRGTWLDDALRQAGVAVRSPSAPVSAG